MSVSEEGSDMLGPDGRTEKADAMLDLLSQEGWCASREIEIRLGLTSLEASRRLYELQARDKVFTAWVPGVNDPPIRLWHRTTSTVRSMSPSGLNMTWLPWRLKRDYVEKASKLLMERRIPQGLPDWIRSESLVEQCLARAGLFHGRPRPDIGFHYRCAWHVNRGDERFTFIPAERAYDFSVGFLGSIRGTLTLPPLDKRTDSEGAESKTVGWFGDDGCEYVAMTDSEWTMVLLSEVARFSVDLATGAVHAPRADDLVAETSRRLLTGAEEWPLLSMFLPMPKYEFELLSHRQV